MAQFVDGPVRVSVPATSANLGPGFDSLGLALSLRDELEAEVLPDGLVVEVDGAGADGVPRDESHLVVRSMRAAFELMGEQPPGLRAQIAETRKLTKGPFGVDFVYFPFFNTTLNSPGYEDAADRPSRNVTWSINDGHVDVLIEEKVDFVVWYWTKPEARWVEKLKAAGVKQWAQVGSVAGALEARQRSESRVRQFVADASHELRTPLASIRGYAELSRRESEPVPTSVRHALGRVESEALRMQGLVEDLLLLARLDAGRALEREPVDLTMIAMTAVGDIHAAAPEHRWRLDLPDEPVEVVGDEGRLRQVLVNLLANARTHTPSGTTVTTSLRREDGEVVLVVTDDGPGVPDELQPEVFERFTRGDDARNRAGGSTGLGLSIVDSVVRAHGGRIELASRPGQTSFAVHLRGV